MIKRFTVCVTVFALFCAVSLCADASALLNTQREWVIAAAKFTVTPSQTAQSQLEDASVLFPKLLLDYFEGSVGRIMQESEIERRVRYELLQERQTLFKSLSDEIRSRDTILFSAKTKAERKKATKESDKKIEQIKKSINVNLQKASDPLGVDPSFTPSLLRPNEVRYVSLERPGDRLLLKPWKDDPAALFESRRAGESERDYEKRVISEKISGVLTGSVAERAGYLQVTVTLTVFPGNEVVYTFTDVGNLGDLPLLATGAAKTLFPFVLNSKPVKLKFEIEPEAARQNARVYIDGRIPDDITNAEVENGKHQIYIYAEGFESKEFTYSFTETDEFIIQVSMPPKKQVFVTFSSDTDADVYTDALPADGAAAVAKGTSLGEFVPQNGESEFFMVENKTDRRDTASLVFKDISFSASLGDIDSAIEKSRADLYNSYAALLFTLPVVFFSNGMKVASKNSQLYGRIDATRAENWNRFATYTNATGLTLGANFLFQLGRYLYTTNRILPKTIEITEEKTKKAKE